MKSLTQDEANRLFEYKDGILYWKNRPKCSRKPKNDMTAGTISSNGYLKITTNQVKYYVHQVIFLIKHGYIPELIDHIDGNTTNNKIENLRASSKSLNACNSKIKSDNKSGHRGVTWHSRAKKWMCQINFNKRTIYLGLHDDFEFACFLADEARRLYHGDYARI
jgi:hypothetical protein